MLRKFLTYYYLFSKRLFKKKSFLILLSLLFVFVFFINISTKKDTSLIDIAIVFDDTDDNLVKEINAKLDKENSVFNFIVVDKGDIDELLRARKVEAVWIFKENFKNNLEKSLVKKQSLVKIIELNDDILLKLAREKLYGILYPYISYSLYEKYIKEINPNEEVDIYKSYYNDISITDELVEFVSLDLGEYKEKEVGSVNNLSVMRGMLAIWLLIGAFFANIYFKYDEKKALFSLISLENRKYIAFLYQLVIVFNLAIVAIISLAMLGLFTNIFMEVLALILFVLASILFASIFSLCIKNINVYFIISIMLSLISLVLSPIFIDLKVQKIGVLFPSFYYINVIYNKEYISAFLLYILVLGIIEFIILSFKGGYYE